MNEDSLPRWVRYGLFASYYDVAWDDSRGDRAAWEKVQAYIKNQSSPNGTKGMLLMGPPGTGKTLMAHLIMVKPWHWRLQRDPLFRLWAMTAEDYMGMLHQHMSAEKVILSGVDVSGAVEDYEAAGQLLYNAKAARWLLLDDLGAEYSTDWSRSRLAQLIRDRGNRACPTILTTNLSATEFAKAYGARTFSFIQQVCEVVTVTGDDQRLKIT